MPGLTGHLSGHKIRTDFADGYPDFEAPFYLLKYTYAAAWPGRSKGKPWQTLPLEHYLSTIITIGTVLEIPLLVSYLYVPSCIVF